MSDNRLDDYIDVAERIGLFYEKYPEGRLACDFRTETLDGSTFLIATGYAYTSPEDTRPGTGTAQELIPGRTAFTRGSEYQNAETSAWGRAIASLGIATKRGIATKQEVAGAQQRRHELTMNKPEKPIERISHSDQTIADDPWQGPPPVDPETGEAAELGSNAAEAVAAEILGAVALPGQGLAGHPRKQYDNAKRGVSDKQKFVIVKKMTAAFDEVVDEDTALLKASTLLVETGDAKPGEVNDWTDFTRRMVDRLFALGGK